MQWSPILTLLLATPMLAQRGTPLPGYLPKVRSGTDAPADGYVLPAIQATSVTSPSTLAVTATHVFALHDGKVLKLPITLAAAEATFAAPPQTCALAAHDAELVALTRDGRLHRLDAASGTALAQRDLPPWPRHDQAYPRALDLNATTLTLTTDKGAFRLDLDAANPAWQPVEVDAGEALWVAPRADATKIASRGALRWHSPSDGELAALLEIPRDSLAIAASDALVFAIVARPDELTPARVVRVSEPRRALLRVAIHVDGASDEPRPHDPGRKLSWRCGDTVCATEAELRQALRAQTRDRQVALLIEPGPKVSYGEVAIVVDLCRRTARGTPIEFGGGMGKGPARAANGEKKAPR